MKKYFFLGFVYEDPNRYKVKKSEDPDFKIADAETGDIFGVEVTKLYYSEASARTKNIKNYLDRALMDQGILHKDDRIKFSLCDIFKVDEAGNKISEVTKCIRRDQPSCWPEYTCRVINSIVEKDSKFKNYDGSLSFINLIICDMECGYKNIPREHFASVFTSENIGKDLVKYLSISKFKKIYFITDLICSGSVLKIALDLKSMFLD
ncbi:MAG: hypothetical protein WCG48_03370 [Candidatus Berkelbacteria bacterium]